MIFGDLEIVEQILDVADDVVRAEIALARSDYPRGQAHNGCPFCGERAHGPLVVVYLQTDRGTTYGSGAHPGHVTAAHLACLPVGWLPRVCPADREDSQTGEHLCGDCAQYSDRHRAIRRGARRAVCGSCLEMAQESERETADRAAFDDAGYAS